MPEGLGRQYASSSMQHILNFGPLWVWLTMATRVWIAFPYTGLVFGDRQYLHIQRGNPYLLLLSVNDSQGLQTNTCEQPSAPPGQMPLPWVCPGQWNTAQQREKIWEATELALHPSTSVTCSMALPEARDARNSQQSTCPWLTVCKHSSRGFTFMM